MNQELMTLDFWQDTVIYEGKTLPVGALACDALNVPADTIAKMNEQCEKINLLLGILNAGQDASALCPIATEAALTLSLIHIWSDQSRAVFVLLWFFRMMSAIIIHRRSQLLR